MGAAQDRPGECCRHSLHHRLQAIRRRAGRLRTRGTLALRQLDGGAGADRFVDRHENAHVAQAFLAANPGRRFFFDAAREVVELRGELIDLGEADLLAVAPAAPVAAVKEGRVEPEPAILGGYAEIADGRRVVRRAAMSDRAAWKPAGPDDRFVDLAVTDRVG